MYIKHKRDYLYDEYLREPNIKLPRILTTTKNDNASTKVNDFTLNM